jgi:hypothetical protein
MGIASITAIELFALSQEVDGVLLTLVIGAITAIATGGAIKLWRK